MISISHLRKTYGDTVAVDDVSLEVAEGEVLGILGPNGAGKTTTVECLAGLRVPDSGTVRVAGLDPLTQRDELTRLLGVQLQESRLQPKITVAEAMRLWSGLYDDPLPWGGLLERLGLDAHTGSKFRDLSGGQQQRLSIALALVGRPRVVVLDELSTGLDPRARRDVWQIVRDLRTDDVTVLLVTHSMEEAQQLCDRIAIIDHGRIQAVDTPEKLKGMVGGDVVTLTTADDERAAPLVGAIAGSAATASDGALRVEVADGAAFVPRLVRELPVEVTSVAFHRPSLDDVFLKLTGRAIRAEEADAKDMSRMMTRAWGRR
jgi:ABC-2 type transport system ATP-binding protein